MRTPSDWFDNHSWHPDPAPEPASKDSEEIPVADDAPQPGTAEYLRLGCDDLYVTLGGEG